MGTTPGRAAWATGAAGMTGATGMAGAAGMTAVTRDESRAETRAAGRAPSRRAGLTSATPEQARGAGSGTGATPARGSSHAARRGASPATVSPVHAPVHAPVAGAVLELVDRSRASLVAACRTGSVSDRFVEAHLAALRAAAALLAARSRPSRRSRLRSVWEVLPEVAPELTEWAVFFASTAQQRAVLERGARVPTTREADDLLRQSETFHSLIRACLGLPPTSPLPELVAATGRP